MKRFIVKSPKLVQDKRSHRMRDHLKIWKAEALDFSDLIKVEKIADA